MDAAALVARLLLATVFAVAAVAKLRDPDATTRSMSALGAGGRYARPAARAVPVAELAVAAGLLIEPLVVPAAIAAVFLLAVFTGAILNALRLKRRPDCGCFGNLLSRRVSVWTVARNIVLIAIAALVAVEGGGSSLAGPLEPLIVAGVTTGLVLLGGRGAAPAGQPDAFRERPPSGHGMALGTPAPGFELSSPCGGRPGSLDSLRAAGLPVVLMFLGGGCGSCRQIQPHLHRWQVTLEERLSIAVVFSGMDHQARELCTDFGIDNVLFAERAYPLWGTYEMPGTPSAVLISADGHIASGSVLGADALEELVRQTIRHEPQIADAWNQLTPVA
jgi:uncharacterized membrane protein YphA (DoxX/SURF4 family)/thiol-disulfide isomerase/thioredoxin